MQLKLSRCAVVWSRWSSAEDGAVEAGPIASDGEACTDARVTPLRLNVTDTARCATLFTVGARSFLVIVGAGNLVVVGASTFRPSDPLAAAHARAT